MGQRHRDEGRIWVFNGSRSSFPSGVFTNLKFAEEWIQQHRLTGMLTAYPLDIGVYQWAIEMSFFKPKVERHTTADFIQSFSSAYLEHYHYEDGKKVA
jgi:hypothetical protein